MKFVVFLVILVFDTFFQVLTTQRHYLFPSVIVQGKFQLKFVVFLVILVFDTFLQVLTTQRHYNFPL